MTPNRSRDHFVSREVAFRVVAACVDIKIKWRVIFSFCRFAGLRCPSEVLALRWDYVNWATSRIRIPCIKTEHHEGRD